MTWEKLAGSGTSQILAETAQGYGIAAHPAPRKRRATGFDELLGLLEDSFNVEAMLEVSAPARARRGEADRGALNLRVVHGDYRASVLLAEYQDGRFRWIFPEPSPVPQRPDTDYFDLADEGPRPLAPRRVSVLTYTPNRYPGDGRRPGEVRLLALDPWRLDRRVEPPSRRELAKDGRPVLLLLHNLLSNPERDFRVAAESGDWEVFLDRIGRHYAAVLIVESDSYDDLAISAAPLAEALESALPDSTPVDTVCVSFGSLISPALAAEGREWPPRRPRHSVFLGNWGEPLLGESSHRRLMNALTEDLTDALSWEPDPDSRRVAARVSRIVQRAADRRSLPLRRPSADELYHRAYLRAARLDFASVTRTSRIRPGQLSEAFRALMLTHDENEAAAEAPPDPRLTAAEPPRDASERPAEEQQERSSDFRIFESDSSGARGAQVPETRQIWPGEYLLEVALRDTRIGIGAGEDRPSIPVSSHSKERILVALEAASGAITLHEVVKPMTLPPTGDTDPILFGFTLGDCPKLVLDIRFYCRLNLIEHVRLEAFVDDPPPDGETAIRVRHRDQFQTFTGDLARACPPRSLSIHVQRDSDQFRLVFASASQDLRLTARPGFGEGDLTKCLLNARELWLKIALGTFATGLKARLDVLAGEDVLALAQLGRGFWSVLFEKDGSEGRAIAEALRALPSDGARIQVSLGESAHTFVFPWSLVYDGAYPQKAGDVAPQHFWGVRHEIEQVRQRRRSPAGSADPAAQNTLALFLDNSIAHAREQVTAIEALTGSATSLLTLATPPIEGRRDFEARLAAGGDALLYFFCHGYTALPASALGNELSRRAAALAEGMASKPEWLDQLFGSAGAGADDCRIMLTHATLELDDLWRIEPPPEAVRPIVILNMCESAQLLPEVGDSFVRFFMDGRARAVLGTECPVPPDFAADFGAKLLERLSQGQAIGAALRELRSEYLTSHRNPLALAYTLWGSASSRIELQPGE